MRRVHARNNELVPAWLPPGWNHSFFRRSATHRERHFFGQIISFPDADVGHAHAARTWRKARLRPYFVSSMFRRARVGFNSRRRKYQPLTLSGAFAPI
jgi:hypothetical protein